MPQSTAGFFRGKKLIYALVLVLAAALAAGALTLFTGRSAREAYLNAEGKEYRRYSGFVSKAYKEFEDDQKPYMTGAYERRTELTVDMKPGSGDFFGLSNAPEIFDIIKRSKLIVDTRRNLLDKTSLTDITMLLERAPFLDAQVMTENRRLTFSVPVLAPERYFSLDEDRIDEVYDRFSIPVRPKRLVNMSDIAETLKFDDTTLGSVAKSYADFFKGIIKEKDVSYGKDTTVDISGKKASGREVFVNLDPAETTELLKNLARRAGNDDALIALTYTNLADTSGLLDEAGLYRLFDYLDKAGIVVLEKGEKEFLGAISAKKDVEGFRKKVSGAFDGYDFPQGLKMRLIIDKAGNILDRIIDVSLEDRSSHRVQTVSIHTGMSSANYEDCRNRFIDFTSNMTTGEGRHFNAQAVFVPYASYGDEKGDIKLDFGTDNKGVQVYKTSVGFAVDSTTDKLTLKKNRQVTCNVTLQQDKNSKEGSITGKINKTSWSSKKFNTRNWNTNVTYSAELPTFGITGLAGAFTLMGEDKFGIGAFSLPKLQPGKTVDLNTATKQQLDAVENEIMSSFGAFYITNKSIVDAVMGK